jgi:hypothetical protein
LLALAPAILYQIYIPLPASRKKNYIKRIFYEKKEEKQNQKIKENW